MEITVGKSNEKRLKKEIIWTCVVVLELMIVCVCIVAVKMNTYNKTNSTETIAHNTLPTPELPSDNANVASSTPVTTTTTPKPNVPTATAKPSPTTKPSSSNKNASAKELFADSVFLGDSRTEGLQLKTGLSSAEFITHRGLTVSMAMTDKVIRLKNGKKGTLIDALKEGKYKKVFVMFGVNELGWPYTSTFKAEYIKLIQAIKKVQPDAKIYIQSIIPVTKTKSDSSNIYNLKNVNKFNKTIKAMAKELKVHYLNVQEAVTKPDTYLPEDSAVDGVHLTKDACVKWLKYLSTKIA